MVGTTGERDLEGLRLEAGDIKACHEVAVTTHFFDVLDSASFPAFVDALPVLPERSYRARLATSCRRRSESAHKRRGASDRVKLFP